MIKVCPSSNPLIESNLCSYAKELENLGVEYLHLDVMDGKFVESRCLRDLSILDFLVKNSNILLDAHLMVEKPLEEIEVYKQFRPVILTVHYESFKNGKELLKGLKAIKDTNALVGISLKPNTGAEVLKPILDYVDLVLIMSVEPGKSGQKFIPSSIDKIKSVKKLIGKREIKIQVDGGINDENYKSVVDAGADLLVMGSAVYNAKDRKEFLSKISSHYGK